MDKVEADEDMKKKIDLEIAAKEEAIVSRKLMRSTDYYPIVESLNYLRNYSVLKGNVEHFNNFLGENVDDIALLE